MKILSFTVLLSLVTFSLANITYSDFSSEEVDYLEDEEDECSGKNGIKESVLNLVRYIAANYLRHCSNVIIYDPHYDEDDESLNFDLRRMLRDFPTVYINAQAKEPKQIGPELLLPVENECRNFILLLKDISWAGSLIGHQKFSKVVVVTVSSRWQIEEYLENRYARDILNFLIISYNWKKNVLFSVEEPDKRIRDINLYTHRLYIDGLGGSKYRILTTWRCNKLARNVDLFPKKMAHGKYYEVTCPLRESTEKTLIPDILLMVGPNRGRVNRYSDTNTSSRFSGRQFVVAASEQPPFTFKRKDKVAEDTNESYLWDGVEIRLLRLLSEFLNYTIEIIEPKMDKSKDNGPSERVIDEVLYGGAEIGSAGVYVTNDRINRVMFSQPHTTDCAAFITKASISIPGHRAILGPFQWTVWLALTLTYMSAILPLTFADSHSLRPLIKNPWLMETMFWHVFGTFTNCFTFTEESSWTKSKKAALRLFVGWYWAFTIIVTACYTGSIVSFITLFIPSTVYDHVEELIKKNFRVGTLSTGGWARWFNDSEHAKTKWLLRDMELVPNATQGLKNVSHSFYLPMFRPYAFLASRAQMEFIVQTNYTTKKKSDMLHISKDCFVPFIVSYVYPLKASYTDMFNEYILRVQQSGLMAKLLNEFKWEIERAASGALFQVNTGSSLRALGPMRRKLNLSDTEGMFVFMAVGYLLGFIALIIESINYARKNRKKRTLKERLSSLLFWRSERFRSVVDWFTAVAGPFIETYFRKENSNENESNYSKFKKYDSRILASRNSTCLINPAFSDMHLNSNKAPLPKRGAASVPNTANTRGEKEKTSERKNRRRKDLDIVFGSINSLPWDINSVVHRRSSRHFSSAQSY